MGWLRKFIVRCIMKEIAEYGIRIGDYYIRDKDGTLTITKVKDNA